MAIQFIGVAAGLVGRAAAGVVIRPVGQALARGVRGLLRPGGRRGGPEREIGDAFAEFGASIAGIGATGGVRVGVQVPGLPELRRDLRRIDRDCPMSCV